METETEREFIGGRYAVERVLGTGGAGAVLLAYDTTLGRWVAIKRMPAEDGAVFKEARTLAGFHHPNIVAVHDVLEGDGEVFLVMEFVQGHTLEDLAEPLTEETFRDIAAQCLAGLSAAHGQGVAHRDIKPGNIMLEPREAGGYQVKIVDFGQSRSMETPSLQTIDQAGAVVGSIHTMSPEQLGRQPLDHRTDLYSLGCVFYQSLTLRPPFQGDNVPEMVAAHLQHRFEPLWSLRMDLPRPLSLWVEGLFAFDREDRPATAEQALRMLETTRTDSKIRLLSGPQKKSTPVVVLAPEPVFKAIPVVSVPSKPIRVVRAATSPLKVIPVVEEEPAVVEDFETPAQDEPPMAVLPVAEAEPDFAAGFESPVQEESPGGIDAEEDVPVAALAQPLPVPVHKAIPVTSPQSAPEPFPGSSVQAPPKSRRPLFISLAGLFAAIALGGAGYFFLSKKSPPPPDPSKPLVPDVKAVPENMPLPPVPKESVPKSQQVQVDQWVLRTFDANKNGSIAREEFRGVWTGQFHYLDSNRDQILSRQEWRNPAFTGLDLDQNGTIKIQEWLRYRDWCFDTFFDADKDGIAVPGKEWK